MSKHKKRLGRPGRGADARQPASAAGTQTAGEAAGTVGAGRWKIAAAGVAMMVMLGTVYGWSVFKKPLMGLHGWTGPQVGLTFTLTIFCIGLAAALGGRFVDRAGARKTAMAGSVVFGLGTILAAYADSIGSLPLLWLGYGIVAGLGNGLCYVTPIAVLARWFPDRRGLITGLAVMGFGLGGALTGQLAPYALRTMSVGMYFYLSGIVFLVLLPLCSRYLVNPPAGAPAPGAARAPAADAVSVDFAFARRTPQFYILALILFINVTAGIALISNLSPFAQAQAGLTPIAAGTLVFVASLFNGFGRTFWAALSDRIGRKRTFLIMLGSQVPMLLLLPAVSNAVVFALLCSYILFCYGGGFGTMPAFAAESFGPRYVGGIYGPILLAWGIAGAVGPTLMEAVKTATGGFSAALYAAAGLLAAGFVLASFYRKPKLA